MTKLLNIAVLGCGFMGRAYSNAWMQVNHFFDCPYQPYLKACYGRKEDDAKLNVFASRWDTMALIPTGVRLLSETTST